MTGEMVIISVISYALGGGQVLVKAQGFCCMLNLPNDDKLGRICCSVLA